MFHVMGWDIGGVNTKVARVAGGDVLAARGRPFEVQRAPEALRPLLGELAADVGAVEADRPAAHAVTMTAELSQMFRTKREGVAFVLDAVEAAFPSSVIRVYTVDGRFLAPEQARAEPLAVAAANWAATARVIAQHHPHALLVDIGTTTTDIIPIVDGVVAAIGRTDPERLAFGELVYTGALRTPTEAITSAVPFGEAMAGVSAEGFALSGDVHLWRGDITADDYTVSTPDGRPATREFAGERLARVICGDRELLDETAVCAIADALAGAQVARITEAVGLVMARHPSVGTAVVTGLGAFLADAAARAAGLKVVPLAAELGEAAARCAPAASVALLLERTLTDEVSGARAVIVGRSRGGVQPSRRSHHVPTSTHEPPSAVSRHSLVETVVKLGGGVLAHLEYFDAVRAAIGAAARERRLLVVPGGGPLADAVRELDNRLQLSDDAAHWMAILAMDQYAHLVATRLTGGVIVEEPGDIASALAAGRVPVLAPSRWLRAADPLPHTWSVTSDSIAAWAAGQVGASQLVLVKPPHVAGNDVVDAYFSHALPAHVSPLIVAADRVDVLQAALRGSSPR